MSGSIGLHFSVPFKVPPCCYHSSRLLGSASVTFTFNIHCICTDLTSNELECAVANCSVCSSSLTACDRCTAQTLLWIQPSGATSCVGSCPPGYYQTNNETACSGRSKVVTVSLANVLQLVLPTARPARMISPVMHVCLVRACCLANVLRTVQLAMDCTRMHVLVCCCLSDNLTR